MKELVFLLVFIILSSAFAVCALIASYICSVHAPNEEKNKTYECGMKLFSDSKIQFNIKFFNCAILFLIFDIETIFLFPFAINFVNLGIYAIVEALIFVLLLFFALVYVLKSDLLRWQ